MPLVAIPARMVADSLWRVKVLYDEAKSGYYVRGIFKPVEKVRHVSCSSFASPLLRFFFFV